MASGREAPRARVVVIGAGVGGLAAAARLAASGHAVTVCEAGPAVGGKLATRTVTRPEGDYRFDLGPTLLTMPGEFRDLFAATGEPWDTSLPLRRLDPIARYRFADGTELDTTSDLVRQRALFDDAFGPGAGAAWQRVIDRGEAIWRAVEHPVFGQPLEPRTALRLASGLRRLDDLRAVAPGRSLRGIARALLTDPRQQLMLERYATYEGSDPRRAPAALAVVPYLEHVHGGWYVDGGLHLLATELAARIRAHGARVLLDTRVSEIEVAGGRVHGVRLADGGRLPADVVVCNADAHLLYGQLLRPPRRRVPPADSLSGFVMLLGLRGDVPGLAHHTVTYGSGRYDDEFDAILDRPGTLVDDPVIYLNTPDDPAVAPAAHRACYVLVNAARHGRDGARGELDWGRAGRAEAYAEHLLDRLAERGLPLRDHLSFVELRTPRDLERETLAPGGAIYGRTLHGPTATFRRPSNRSTVRGVFLVGGSTHPGGGLPLVTMSARVVANLIDAG